jgi:Branched-chain amino acid ATP-binding cassette transporter
MMLWPVLSIAVFCDPVFCDYGRLLGQSASGERRRVNGGNSQCSAGAQKFEDEGRGRLRLRTSNGAPEKIRRDPKVIEAYLGRSRHRGELIGGSEKVVPGTIEMAKALPMHLSKGNIAKDVVGQSFNLTEKDFWWVINRLIHALDVYIKPFDTNVEVYGRGKLRIEQSLNYIAFRSDFDDPGTFHHISLEDLLITFLSWVLPALEQACGKHSEPLTTKTQENL